ncbi:MAG: RHS repeat-associated core domain-containing protein [Cyclobacteriaceae bacterium]
MQKELKTLTDPDILRYRYTGQEYDSETGLYNYRARLYDAKTGRFLSVDPKAQFASPYMAMGNNPVMMIDPDGQLAWFAPIIIGVAINLMINDMQGNINSGWDALKYGAIGGVSGLAGFGIGQVVAGAVGTIGFTGAAITGASSGFAGGFVGGAGNAWAGGNSFSNGLVSGVTAGAYGALIGGVIGGISGGMNATKHGGNSWSGKRTKHDIFYIQGNYKGDPVEYNNESAKEFSDKWFGKDIKGVDNLYANGSIPDGYTMKGDAVFNRKGNEVLGTTSYNGTGKGSNVYLYKKSFEASQKLYMTMGHEYIHVGHLNAGLFNARYSEHAALTWSRNQSKAFGIISYNETWANELLNTKYYSESYDYNKFMINPIFNSWMY